MTTLYKWHSRGNYGFKFRSVWPQISMLFCAFLPLKGYFSARFGSQEVPLACIFQQLGHKGGWLSLHIFTQKSLIEGIKIYSGNMNLKYLKKKLFYGRLYFSLSWCDNTVPSISKSPTVFILLLNHIEKAWLTKPRGKSGFKWTCARRKKKF